MGKIKQQKGGFQSKACNRALKDAIGNYNNNIKQSSDTATATATAIDKLLLLALAKDKPQESSCTTKEECQNICVSYSESIPTINRLQNEIYLLNYALDVLNNIYNEKTNFKDATPIITKINYLVDLKYVNKDNAVLKLNSNTKESLEDTIIKENINKISKKIDEKVTEIIILSRSNYLIKNINNDHDVSIYKNPSPNLYKHRNYINNNTTKYIHILANSPLLREHNKRSTLLIDAYKSIDYDKQIEKTPILNNQNLNSSEEALIYGQYKLETEQQLISNYNIGLKDKIKNKLKDLNTKYNTLPLSNSPSPLVVQP
jgi:hypothetical protein